MIQLPARRRPVRFRPRVLFMLAFLTLLSLGMTQAGSSAKAARCDAKTYVTNITDEIVVIGDPTITSNMTLHITDGQLFVVDIDQVPAVGDTSYKKAQLGKWTCFDELVAGLRGSVGGGNRLVITHAHPDHTGWQSFNGVPFLQLGVMVEAHNMELILHRRTREALSATRCLDFKEPNNVLPAWEPDWPHQVVEQQWSATLLNGERVTAHYLARAHTGGDLMVVFEDANVVVMGDLYFNRWYPFLDLHIGGSVRGMIAAIERVIDITDDETVIVPGHGKPSGKADLIEYLRMLETVTNKIDGLIKDNHSLDDIKLSAPTDEFDSDWNNGPVTISRFVELIYHSLLGTQRHPDCRT